MLIQAPVGPQVSGDTSSPSSARLGRLGEMIVQELHGRFHEQTYRGNLFSGANNAGTTAINNATYTIATLGATCTPILGLYNPVNSPTNAVILQALLATSLSALTVTGPIGFAWYASAGNSAVSTGTKGVNRKVGGAGANALSIINTALTGLTNNLASLGFSGLAGGSQYSVSEVGTAAGFHTSMVVSTENLDGSIVVPPGGVLALLALQTPVGHNAIGGLLWEEVAV